MDLRSSRWTRFLERGKVRSFCCTDIPAPGRHIPQNGLQNGPVNSPSCFLLPKLSSSGQPLLRLTSSEIGKCHLEKGLRSSKGDSHCQVYIQALWRPDSPRSSKEVRNGMPSFSWMRVRCTFSRVVLPTRPTIMLWSVVRPS